MCKWIFILLISIALGNQTAFSQNINNLKITDNLGLTRAYKNNVKSTHTVVITIQGHTSQESISILNSENGQSLKADKFEKVNQDTHYTFNSVTSGNWVIDSKDLNLKINEVKILLH